MIQKKRRSIATLVSEKEITFLRDCYPRVKNRSALTAAFNSQCKRSYTISQIRGVLNKHDISSGRTGRIPPGNLPWNKNSKGTGVVKGNSTSFTAGHIPANLTEMYAERISTDGYIEIKVPEINNYTGSETKYKKKHLFLWERHYGKIQKGCCVVFLDGNSLNCTLSNLALLSKAENLDRNRQNRYLATDCLFRETARLLRKLQNEVKKAKRRV